MTVSALFLPGSVLAIAALAPWCLNWALRPLVRGAALPAALARATAIANVVLAALLILLARVEERSVTFGQLWRHDPWSALLLGALAGLFLHFAGSGSPLPIASLREQRPARGAGVILFVLGATATVAIWFGAGLPSLLLHLHRLPALLLIACGYGLTRGGSGQDHVLLGAIDGLLLGLLGILTGSIVAVLLAQLVADVWAYVSAAAQAEELALEAEAGQPNLPAWRPHERDLPEDRVERLG
jgi:hypothetical protein